MTHKYRCSALCKCVKVLHASMSLRNVGSLLKAASLTRGLSFKWMRCVASKTADRVRSDSCHKSKRFNFTFSAPARRMEEG